MPPDFSKKTIETLGKRAAYKCSNPDCRVSTVGPNSDSNKSTVIGEAAHIYGARPASKRYRFEMTNAARAEITNSIWLCRNCHKRIDTDDEKYTSDVLFAWREQHEMYVQSELGTSTDRIRFEQQEAQLSQFGNLPPIIRRIVIDKPDGWEFRLTAELMRYLNRPLFRKFEDLRDGLYVRPQEHVDEDEVIKWVQTRLVEGSNLINPLNSLLGRLNKSWGESGEPGDVEEIYHITHLIRDYLDQIVKHEERIYFVNVPNGYEDLIDLIKDLIGSQAKKLGEIPEHLDEVVSLIDADVDHGGTVEDPYIIEKTITLELPENWNEKIDREMKRANKRHSGANGSNGCWIILILAIIIFIILIL